MLVPNIQFIETFQVKRDSGELVPQEDITVVSSTAMFINIDGTTPVDSVASVLSNGLVSLSGIVPELPVGSHLRTSVTVSVGGTERTLYKDSGTVSIDTEARLDAQDAYLEKIKEGITNTPGRQLPDQVAASCTKQDSIIGELTGKQRLVKMHKIGDETTLLRDASEIKILRDLEAEACIGCDENRKNNTFQSVIGYSTKRIHYPEDC